jgi:hypothetical protein
VGSLQRECSGKRKFKLQLVRENILSDVWWDKVNYILKFTAPIYGMIRLADTGTPCLHLIYETWDSMIENVKKNIYLFEGNELEDTDCYFFNVIKEILISRWAKRKYPSPLHGPFTQSKVLHLACFPCLNSDNSIVSSSLHVMSF